MNHLALHASVYMPRLADCLQENAEQIKLGFVGYAVEHLQYPVKLLRLKKTVAFLRCNRVE